jgi:outer membrane biosynthesis protein TonB
MRRTIALLAALCIIVLAPSNAGAKGKQTGPFQIGESRDLSSRKTKVATMSLFWSDYEQDFMREPALDEANNKMDEGPYPNKDQKAQDHDLQVRLGISEVGTVTNCEILKPSEVQSINDHACSHLIRYARFHPALDMQGQAIAVAGEVSVYYSIYTFDRTVIPKPPQMVQVPAGFNGQPNRSEAGPLESIAAADLALTPDLVAERKITWLALSVHIDENGVASQCRFLMPTYDNAFDRDICAKMVQQKFKPAIDYEGEPRSGHYSLTLDFEPVDSVTKP